MYFTFTNIYFPFIPKCSLLFCIYCTFHFYLYVGGCNIRISPLGINTVSSCLPCCPPYNQIELKLCFSCVLSSRCPGTAQQTAANLGTIVTVVKLESPFTSERVAQMVLMFTFLWQHSHLHCQFFLWETAAAVILISFKLTFAYLTNDLPFLTNVSA